MMESVAKKLKEIEILESRMDAEWASIIKLRKNFDVKLGNARAAENEVWKKRFLDRCNKEDVSLSQA